MTVRRPLFLVGPVRSGTTLLRLMLDSHPEICNFGEFEYSVKYANGDSFPPVSRYKALLSNDRAFKSDGFALPSTGSYNEIVQSFLGQARQRSAKPIVGGTVHSRCDLLPKLWPDCRIVFLTRDPRDVARSCIHMGWCGNVWYGANVWNEGVQRVKRLCDQIPPENFLVIRYEDLVADVATNLTKICNFIDCEYHPAMLDYHLNSTYEPIDPRLASQWQRKLSQREIELVEAKCQALMMDWFYEPTTSCRPPGTWEKFRLATQNRIWRWKFNIKRYGMPLYLKWQVVKRVTRQESPLRRQVQSEVDEITTRHLK